MQFVSEMVCDRTYVLVGFVQTPTQSLIGNEKNTMCYMSRIGFYILLPHHVFHPKSYFFTISFDDCQNLQWWLGFVWLWCKKQLPIALWQIGAQCLLELICLSGVTNLYIMC